MKVRRQVLLPGQLSPVPRFQELPRLLPPGPARDCYVLVHETIVSLGRAVQLGQHRLLIDTLCSTFDLGTLFAISDRCIHDAELCAAFSVYFTTLEQSYHWPRDKPELQTPASLHDHKVVIQVLNEPELRAMLQERMGVSLDPDGSHAPSQVAQAALAMAGWMLCEAREADEPLGRDKQDHVNLLYRTCRNDWNIQGDYRDITSHLEFGRLHDVVRTNGTQRRIQEVFEDTGGLYWFQRLPTLLGMLPMSTPDICKALMDLQVTVMRINDELFSMMIDETLWGRTFAKFSKAVGMCTVSAGGADCAVFRMLDALCGRADDKSQAMLLDELDFRSRFFPPNMRALIDAVAGSPSIRHHVRGAPSGSYALLQAFNALQRALWALYEMHRKKALRIVLALRAGQAKTSSGTQKAISPEQHIGNTLGEAIRVRFGSDPHALHIEAYGWSTPLLYGQGGQIEAACIRLALSTPLAVSPGDAVRISVEVERGRWQTRTYSVMRAAPHWHSGVASADAATSIEVCVRRQGTVSSFLCNHSAGFPTRVAVCPAPHFRIQKNDSADGGTVFVAQGAAAALFVTWLEQQRQSLKGRYTLVVGARSASQLVQLGQFKSLAISSNGNADTQIDIIVCLSAPAVTDIAFLQSAGIQTYVGRVPQYLQSVTRHISGDTVYVCGSASFGMDVARWFAKLGPQDVDIASTSRLAPICTSRLPDLRLHVAPGVVSTDAMQRRVGVNSRIITRGELAQHNVPDDMWMAVRDRVYNVTPVIRFHPGGEKLLSYWAGRQAGEIFALVHGDSYDVTGMLHELDIGMLAPASADEITSNLETRLDKLVEIQNDLMNNSRFEQSPTGDAAQLPLAPPVDVIRGALDVFVKSWSQFAHDGDSSEQVDASSLAHSLGHTWSCLDQYQTRIYQDAFDSVEQCAQALHKIFQILLTTIGKIHSLLDQLKADIELSMENKTEMAIRSLRTTTEQIALLLSTSTLDV